MPRRRDRDLYRARQGSKREAPQQLCQTLRYRTLDSNVPGTCMRPYSDERSPPWVITSLLAPLAQHLGINETDLEFLPSINTHFQLAHARIHKNGDLVPASDTAWQQNEDEWREVTLIRASKPQEFFQEPITEIPHGVLVAPSYTTQGVFELDPHELNGHGAEPCDTDPQGDVGPDAHMMIDEEDPTSVNEPVAAEDPDGHESLQQGKGTAKPPVDGTRARVYAAPPAHKRRAAGPTHGAGRRAPSSGAPPEGESPGGTHTRASNHPHAEEEEEEETDSERDLQDRKHEQNLLHELADITHLLDGIRQRRNAALDRARQRGMKRQRTG